VLSAALLYWQQLHGDDDDDDNDDDDDDDGVEDDDDDDDVGDGGGDGGDSDGELMDLKLPNEADSQWLSQGGRDLAAAFLLPRAEAALRKELQQLADAVKRARQGQS
jgi:hypothetical protein